MRVREEARERAYRPGREEDALHRAGGAVLRLRWSGAPGAAAHGSGVRCGAALSGVPGARAGESRGAGGWAMSGYTVEDIPLGYAPVPPEMLLHRPKLKDADVKVWCAFAMHRNLRTGKTSAGVVRIAEILDVDRSTVTRAIARLIGAGFLIRRYQRRDEESGKFCDAEYTLAVGGKPVQLALVHRRTAGEDAAPDRGASARHGDADRDASRGASAHGKRSGKEDGKNPTTVGVKGEPLHRADTYVRKVSGECEMLGVPLDAAEKRNLGRYLKDLIQKQGANPTDLLRFSSHYATRRAENSKIRPSQAWADVAGGSGVDGGGASGRAGTGSTAVVGASEDLFEGEF